MPGENIKTDTILGKGESMTGGLRPRVTADDEFTHIDLAGLDHDYKLAKAYANIRNLEFRADKKIKEQRFSDFLKMRPPALLGEFTALTKRRPRYPRGEAYRNRRLPHLYTKGRMLVIVDNTIFGAVARRINRYVLDVGRDGYWATVHTVQGGTPADIRHYIKVRKPVGVLLVGAVAAPWFELDNDFHGAHTEFPCDLYYMDTNGTWTDPDGDGKFSTHGGNLNPEIWIGRLWTPTQGGNDPRMINDYLDRNHQFRLGKLGHARSALSYVDDDWQSFSDCGFDQQFPPSEITIYTDPNTTDADLYKAEVNSLRSWVQLCAHSWPHGHALHVPSAGGNEYIHNTYFRDTNPPNAHFYNLFCCGPGKFTTPDYLAGWYIFDKSGGGRNNGLTAVASAKSGSMLLFEDFYRPLGQGKCIGDAFVEWWKARGPNHDLNERRWYYGLVLLGDPTLSWFKGVVPDLRHPQEGDVFDQWPRKMNFRWDSVEVPNARYTLQVDYFDGRWAEESGRACYTYHNLKTTTQDHVFVGAQPGRWRVRAIVDGRECAWSPWRYFRYTI
jgi:hypothetical protein